MENENFRLLLENISEMVTVISLKGEIIYQNSSVKNVLGYEPTELVGKNCLDYIYQEDHLRMLFFYRKIESREKSMVFQCFARKKDGSSANLESLGRRFQNHQGETLIVVTSRLVSQSESNLSDTRCLAKTRLLEIENKFRVALKTARMIWWEWNCETDEVLLSDNFSEIYGIADVKNFDEGISLIHPADREKYLEIFGNALTHGKSYYSEFRVIRPDNGEIIWLEENAAPFADKSGQTRKMIGITIDVTKQKNVENALRESEERFRAQYKSLSVPAYVWKKIAEDFVLTDYNDVAESVYFRNISSNLGKNVADIFADSPQIVKAMQECFETKSPVKISASHYFDSIKQSRELDFNFVFINPDVIMLYTYDVTEYRKIIDSLKISESRFQLVSRATNDVLWEWTLSDNSIWWSENIEKAFGYTKDTYQKGDWKLWSENIHPDYVENVFSTLEEALKSGKSYWTEEYLFRRTDGSYAYVIDRGYIERDQNGQAVKMIGAITDLTKRKQTETALLESRERLSLAQQVGKIGSFDWNLQSGEIITSMQMENIYGAPQNFGGSYKNWLKYIHPEDLARVKADFEKVLTEGNLINEFRIISADGEFRWIQSHIKVFYDDFRQPLRIVGVNMDATERKLAENALQESQERLRQSQKLESVGRLAGGIAHDFNNMLTAINGYSDLILRTLEEDSPLRRKVVEIKKAGERSAELTHQLLAFSRQQILQTKLIDVNQIISDMNQLLSRLIGEDIELILNLHPEECFVKADPGQLSQVVMNLVVNARDAMPEGGNLKISTSQFSADNQFAANNSPMQCGDYIVLAVEDTGSGMDEKTRKYIFDPFFTTRKNSGGTGLGLATVYGIVKQFEGFIWVDSELGKGSCFKIYLPCSGGKVTLPEAEKSIRCLQKGAEHILLVEDEESVRNLTRQILDIYEYDVICAADGIEALKICNESKPPIDLLITDVVMPQMNGHKLAEKIKEIYPKIKILYTSGYTDEKLLIDKLQNSEKNYIQKPYSPDSLAKKIREILDSSETD